MEFNLNKIGLDPILHFESIARLKGLNLAARELGLSQPAVTHSLNKLEDRLGIRLCVRSRSGFALTEPGRRLYKLAQEITSGLKGFHGFLHEDERFDGLLNVGILDNFQNDRFEFALCRVIKKFPKIRLNIQIHTSDEIQKLVSVGEMDVGLGIFNKKISNMTYKMIGQERIHHFISERHSLWKKKEIHREDLKGKRIAWSDFISRDRRALEAEIFVDEKVHSMEVAAYSNNLNAALLVLGSGACVVPLPIEFIESKKLSFRYRKIDQAFKPYTLKQEMVTRRDFTSAFPAARFFIEQFGQD